MGATSNAGISVTYSDGFVYYRLPSDPLPLVAAPWALMSVAVGDKRSEHKATGAKGVGAKVVSAAFFGTIARSAA